MGLKKNKKLYLVCREVFASSVKEALRAKGEIYKIELVGDEYQPKEKMIPLGFKTKHEKTTL